MPSGGRLEDQITRSKMYAGERYLVDDGSVIQCKKSYLEDEA